jgi:hypothetical protein
VIVLYDGGLLFDQPAIQKGIEYGYDMHECMEESLLSIRSWRQSLMLYVFYTNIAI